MNTTQRAGLLQRWSVVQTELLPELGLEVEGLTPKLWHVFVLVGSVCHYVAILFYA